MDKSQELQSTRKDEEKGTQDTGAQAGSQIPQNSDEGGDGPIVVVFEPGDPEDPRSWPPGKKVYLISLFIFITLNSTLSSSIPSGAINVIAEEFDVTSEIQLALPISVFLIGYIVGPLFFAPLSEVYGRRPVLVYTFVLYVCFTLGTALINSFPGLLVLRFFAGTAASAPLSVVGGLIADCYGDPVSRGRVIALFGTGTMMGPTLSPLISGYLGKVSWRWPFWFSLIIAGVTLVPLLFAPETFAPVLLAKRAARMRKEQGRDDIVAKGDPANINMKELFSVNLTRPVTMLFTEPMVSVVSLYMAYVYGVMYLFFQGYPVVFRELYGLEPGFEGLAYLPLGVGSGVSAVLVVLWDSTVRKKQARDPSYKLTSEYHRLVLANVGGPLIVISLFWLGWTARESVHFIVPLLAGLPFGIGATTIFMALMNYLGDAYGIYSAPALAISACTRSITGTLLPMAARPMYRDLGIAWANSLLGFIALAMVAIPFVFSRYGQRIRAKSPFCQMLLERGDAGV